MSKAVLSKNHPPAEFGDEDEDRPAAYGVMAGALPLQPDDKRDLENVLADHANAAWGEIRNVCPLDREHAERVLVAAFRRLLSVVKGDANAAKLQELALRRVAGRLYHALLESVRIKNGDREFSTCRKCHKRIKEHAENCPVRAMAKLCQDMNIEPSK